MKPVYKKKKEPKNKYPLFLYTNEDEITDTENGFECFIGHQCIEDLAILGEEIEVATYELKKVVKIHTKVFIGNGNENNH